LYYNVNVLVGRFESFDAIAIHKISLCISPTWLLVFLLLLFYFFFECTIKTSEHTIEYSMRVHDLTGQDAKLTPLKLSQYLGLIIIITVSIKTKLLVHKKQHLKN